MLVATLLCLCVRRNQQLCQEACEISVCSLLAAGQAEHNTPFCVVALSCLVFCLSFLVISYLVLSRLVALSCRVVSCLCLLHRVPDVLSCAFPRACDECKEKKFGSVNKEKDTDKKDKGQMQDMTIHKTLSGSHLFRLLLVSVS